MKHAWGSRVGIITLVEVMMLSAGLVLMADRALAEKGDRGDKDHGSATDLSGVTQNWDKVLPVAQRFVILAAFNNQAVLDRETGLVWEQNPSTAEQPWVAALVICADKTVGGRKGWRLPSFAELASLVDPSVTSGPKLPTGHPFTFVESRLGTWAATQDAYNPASTAWGVFFDAGNVGRITAGNSHKMWCVRGPMNASPY